MAHGYSSAGRQSHLQRPDLPAEVHVQQQLPHRCAQQTSLVNSHKSHRTNYPPEAPEVVFVKDATHPIPMHPHVYSNGIICLDLLDRQAWSPVHNVESVCISLQSMLTSNTKNERPPGDEDFVRHNTRRPRDINFYFHDNTV
jgi:hypothetical protein